MTDEFYRRSVEMLREEKGVWNQVLKVLLQFREEATGRTFRFLRSKSVSAKSILDVIFSLLEDRLEQMISLLNAQLRLVAEKEARFLKGVFGLPLTKHPRKIERVQGYSLGSGWLTQIFRKAKKRIRKTLQYSLSQNHLSDELLDRVFGVDLPKTLRVGKWSGTDFQGGALSEVKRTLQSLVTTSFYSMISKVRTFAYKRASQVETFRSVAILDGKTTSTCQEHDGLLYDRKFKPVGHSKKFVDVPRHWNCRSQVIPFEVDGKKLSRVSFEAWFKKLGSSAQNSLLGSRGGDLYRTEGSNLLSILKRLPPVYLG